MPQEILNIGNSINDGNGDSLREGFNKSNNNFTELYGILGTSLFPYTGSGQITSGSNLPSPYITLGITASYVTSPSFNPPYPTTPGIEVQNGEASTITISGSIFPHPELGAWINDPGLFYITQAKKQNYAANTYFEIKASTTYNYIFSRVNDTFQSEISFRRFLTAPTYMPLNSTLINVNERKCVTNIYGTTNLIPIINVRGETSSISQMRVGIKTDFPKADLHVVSDVYAENYIGTSLQSTDPGVEGQFFTQTSNQIFGDGGSTKILCESQG